MSEAVRDLAVRVGGAILDIFAGLDDVVESAPVLTARLAEHGWVTGDLVSAQPLLEALPSPGERTQLRSSLESLRQGGTPELSSLKSLGEAAAKLLEDARTAQKPGGALTAPYDQQAFWDTFPAELAQELVAEYLELHQPVLFAALTISGVIAEVERSADADSERRSSRGLEVDWAGLPKLLGGPGELFKATYGWGGPLNHGKLVAAALRTARALGAQAILAPPPQALIAAYYTPTNPVLPTLAALEIALFRRSDRALGYADVRLLVVPIPERGDPAGVPKGIWIGAAARGELESHVGLGASTTLSWRGGVSGALPGGIELLPSGPGISMPSPPDQLDLGLGVSIAPEQPWRPLGAQTGTRITLAGAGVEVALRGKPTDPEVALRVSLDRLLIVVDGGEGDGFLQKILPATPQSLEVAGALTVSSRTGVGFEGQAALEIALALELQLGPVVIRELRLGISASTQSRLRLDAGATITGALGPVTFAVERVGVSARVVAGSDPAAIIRFDQAALAFGFKPPKGIGLNISAGPVTGGGYLFFDLEQEQYAGVVQLSFKALGLTAVGLLTTRMPDGSRGFSLLIIVAVEFPPIQLGFGFTLSAVGGLLGINRTVVTNILREGVCNRTLDSILFPKDPVARAPQLLSDLRAVFPPAAGRFTLGPMVRLGWGPNALLKAELALILELPSPVRLAVLGRISVVLPDAKSALVLLQLDVVGVLDFARGEVSVDASLVDSRIAAFTLSGDMALRAGWGATKQFALSAGGFHPSFERPTGFPALRRLTIALATSENPRIRLESYLAITANTFQTGARLDLYASVDTFVGTFSVAAWVGFDALFQFAPFRFVVDLFAGIDVAHNGKPVLHAELFASLSGPSPWHATGFVAAQFIIKFRIGFELTIGETATEERDVVRLRQMLAAEIVRPESWSATPPGDSARIVSLAGKPEANSTIVHPLGEVALRQRLLPFGLSIEVYGTAVPDVGPERFELSALFIGSERVMPSPLSDDFAAAQFLELTDDEKLALPAFQSMQSGGRGATTGGFRTPSNFGVVASEAYVERVIDAPDGAPPSAREGAAGPLRQEIMVKLADAGAAGRSAVQTSGPERFRGPALAVTVEDERWIAADTATLAPLVGGAPTSYARARQAAPHAGGPGRLQEVVRAHEVAA